MTGIFAAKNIKIELLDEDPDGVSDASADGRNFAVSGGVAKAGKYNGYLLEGMACPGGCVAGAGTNTVYWSYWQQAA